MIHKVRIFLVFFSGLEGGGQHLPSPPLNFSHDLMSGDIPSIESGLMDVPGTTGVVIPHPNLGTTKLLTRKNFGRFSKLVSQIFKDYSKHF